MPSNHSFQTRDGISLRMLSDLPDHPRGIILFVHGLGEHTGRYTEHFKRFSGKGFACIGFDLRGHGESEGRRGHAPSYAHLMDDIQEMVDHLRATYRDLPLFIYGHSLGGNLVFNYLLKRNPPEIAAAVITSPWIKLRTNPSSFKMFLAGLMNKIIPSYSENNSLDPSHLSRDPKVAEAYNNDPLVHDRISARLFTSAARAGRYILHHVKELKIPVLLIHGKDDPITSPDASENAARSNPEMIRLRIFPNMLHETHNEIDNAEVVAEELGWLEENL